MIPTPNTPDRDQTSGGGSQADKGALRATDDQKIITGACQDDQLQRLRPVGGGYHEWKSCIDACLQCAAVCNHCASSCTREDDVKMMAQCIELDMQCSAVCYTAAQLMSMGSPHAKAWCAICADICDACGQECGKHQTSHCQECSALCKACAEECRKMSA